MPSKKKPKARWGNRAARREDILAAGRWLLESEGYAGLSMRLVADRAEVSPGTLYTYFTDKEELFAALYTERLELLKRELLNDAFDSACSAEDVIVAFMERYFEVYALHGRAVDVWASASGSGAQAIESQHRLIAAATGVIAAVREAIARLEPGLATAAEMDLAVPFLWASLNGLAEHFCGSRHLMHPYSRAELTSFAARALLAGLRGIPPLAAAASDREAGQRSDNSEE
jgi:AcrR family transcriptional regulator